MQIFVWKTELKLATWWVKKYSNNFSCFCHIAYELTFGPDVLWIACWMLLIPASVHVEWCSDLMKDVYVRFCSLHPGLRLWVTWHWPHISLIGIGQNSRAIRAPSIFWNSLNFAKSLTSCSSLSSMMSQKRVVYVRHFHEKNKPKMEIKDIKPEVNTALQIKYSQLFLFSSEPCIRLQQL